MRDFYHRNLINQIKRAFSGKNPEILQLRYGSGIYSKLLKTSYPDGKITLLEKTNENEDKIDLSLFKNVIFEDYSDHIILKLEEKFDIVTLGSKQNFNLFSTKFNINTEEEFISLIKYIDYYLKPSGEIIILTRSDKFDNKSQKNFIKALYFKQSYDNTTRTNKKILNEQQMVKTFKTTLSQLGNYYFKTEHIKKNPLLQENLKCIEYLNKHNYNPLPEIKEKALKIDIESKKYGQENGYLLFLRAKKQR
ncbi:MAG: hypothetical protein M0R46_16795 [Candidatus Muirbacterium halophilum]|nr:hypothetical protein [Candidatus Muirbacterium halophilum]MCK9477575.1 hypothetical protein [Candidatus Muirbacterium halophilum]